LLIRVTAHIFDMDGTLLVGTTAPLLLAEALGTTDSLHELEERFAAGTATAVEFARELHARWGLVPAATVEAAFDAAPLLLNIREVLSDIRARGEKACLITMSPSYFAERFLEFGFDAVFGSRFPADTDTPFDETGILNPEDKPRLAGAFCREHGLRLDEAVAYGDSMSDVHLFRAVGVSVAVNGDHHVAELADLAVDGQDLLAAYHAARERIDHVQRAHHRRS
jgi:phosphoserine phosphatase